MLTEVEQLLADFWCQRRFTGLLGKALRRLLSLPEGAEFVIPRAFEFGGCQTVGWIDLLIAAPGQGGAEARLTHLLLMVRLKTLALPLALRHDLVQRLELRRRYGSEKGLDHKGLDRGPIEMRTPRFGEGAVHTRAEVPRAGTIGHMHTVPAAAAGGKPLQQGSALAGRALPALRLVGVALGVRTQAGLIIQVLGPTNVGWVGILDDALPFLHRAASHGRRPLPPWWTPGIAGAPPMDEGAGIGGVRQDGANRRFGGWAPADVVGAHATTMAPRQEDAMVLAVPEHPVARAQFLKLAED